MTRCIFRATVRYLVVSRTYRDTVRSAQRRERGMCTAYINHVYVTLRVNPPRVDSADINHTRIGLFSRAARNFGSLSRSGRDDVDFRRRREHANAMTSPREFDIPRPSASRHPSKSICMYVCVCTYVRTYAYTARVSLLQYD